LIPRVAVVIPARNAAAFLAEALDSVFAQDLPAAEVVVVDGGSTDGTGGAARGYGRGVRVVAADGAGRARARNLGIAATRSELIAFLDADDLWVPEKTSRQAALLAAHPDLALVFSDLRTFRGARRSERSLFEERGFAGACTASSIYLTDMVATSTVLLRREALRGCGGFDEELPAASEADLWLRLALRHRFAAVAEPLVLKRIHAGNAAPDARPRAAAQVEVWGRHLEAVAASEPHMGGALRSDYAEKRWRHLVIEGAVALNEGRRAEARRRFLHAILARPGRARTYALMGATFLREGALRRLGTSRVGGVPTW
jgi:glycosyltransferase involved in cell wall biosynthesis